MDIRAHNRDAWDRYVEEGNKWTLPVSAEEIARAQAGEWGIVLTPTIPVPRDWYPELAGAQVLCLASGGGQQGPILAAAGAVVMVFDNSPRQLERDRLVAERDDLSLTTVEGDMRDLGIFPDAHFNLIVHPVSNLFIPELDALWAEAYRVLKPGGVLLAGFTNPLRYLFDEDLMDDEGILTVRHKLPYAEPDALDSAQIARYVEEGRAFEFSHSLEAQIGGQLGAGFILTGFYEDTFGDEFNDPISKFTPSFIATRALKPDRSM
jgi:SAM-dependent methyltransferase